MTVSMFGKSFEMGVWADPNYLPLGGNPRNLKIGYGGEIVKEGGTGSRSLQLLKGTDYVPKIAWEMNVKRLDDYIDTYAMVTAQGAAPNHDLRYDDGAEEAEFQDAIVNTCRLTIRAGARQVMAAIEAYGLDDAVQAIGTVEKRTEQPIVGTDATLNLGGALVNWKEIVFGVNNNVKVEHLGTVLTPADIEDTEAHYSGHIILSRRVASRHAVVKAGTSGALVITLADHQTVPVTTTYTFSDATYKSAETQIPGGMSLERIEWEASDMDMTV